MSEGFTVELSDRAKDQLQRLDREVATRIAAKLRWLARNAEAIQHKPLAGPWRGYYRLRIGDYRAIYGLDESDRLVVVEVIGHRRDIYDE